MTKKEPVVTKRRYFITVTDSVNPGSTYEGYYDEVSISENKNVTPLYKSGMDSPFALIPSAKTVLSIKGVRVDHSVNPDGFHTILDPASASIGELGELMKPADVIPMDRLNKAAQASADKSLAKALRNRVWPKRRLKDD